MKSFYYIPVCYPRNCIVKEIMEYKVYFIALIFLVNYPPKIESNGVLKDNAQIPYSPGPTNLKVDAILSQIYDFICIFIYLLFRLDLYLLFLTT